MSQPRTFLQCSHRTALFLLLVIFTLFLCIGCAAMLRKTGIPQAEADRLAAAAHERLADAAADAVENIKEGLEQGKPLPAIATETASAFAWQIATIGASTIGAVLSGLMAKWLGTERKINKVLITAIEPDNSSNVKTRIKSKAIAAGVEDTLHRRVQALT